MKKILVPTDFSEPAGNATELATRLAIQHGASIHLVHSVDVPADWAEGRFSNVKLATKPLREQQGLFPEAKARVGKARQAMEEITLALSKKKVQATYDLAPNAAWEDITRLARNLKADLIVMGTRGAGAMKEAFIGSNTQKVVRLAGQPVLTLHHDPPSKIAHVSVLVDPLERGIDRHIARLLEPLQAAKTRFHLLYVNTPGRFQDTDTSLELLRTVSKKLSFEASLALGDHFSVAEGALAHARREGMDAIALITHGRSGLQGILNTSVAESIVNNSPVPVLTLRVG
jgi:nucleotide-binding universal stress UspA family protein